MVAAGSATRKEKKKEREKRRKERRKYEKGHIYACRHLLKLCAMKARRYYSS